VGFRQLASNAALSLQKGHRVVVTGRLRIRDWHSDEKKGINVEIDAEAIGHDLTWGTAAFTRSAMTRVAESEAGERSAGDGESADGTGPGSEPEDGGEAPIAVGEPAGAVAPF